MSGQNENGRSSRRRVETKRAENKKKSRENHWHWNWFWGEPVTLAAPAAHREVEEVEPCVGYADGGDGAATAASVNGAAHS